jgi:hypothetical protein
MALTPQRTWARVPSTLASDCAAALVEFPPPCLQRAQSGKGNVPLGPPPALCSPVGGKGRLVPTTWVSLSMTETVEAPMPVWMPVDNQASTPSCGGREGIDGSSVSHCPEANCRSALFMYYSYCRNRKKYTKSSTTQAGQFLLIFQASKQCNGNAPSPLLIVGDSRYSTVKPKARQPLDPDPTPNTPKA